MNEHKVLFLTSDVERPHFEQYVRGLNPNIQVGHAASLEELKVQFEVSGPDVRIIAFLTDVIVPSTILDALTLTPYNIHPGPPEYPGSHPESFAIWNGARSFGATAHVITRRVDEGEIVGCDRFEIEADIKRVDLGTISYAHCIDVFRVVAAYCALQVGPIPVLDVAWSGPKSTKADFIKLCHAPAGLPVESLERLKRACGKDFVDFVGNVKKKSA